MEETNETEQKSEVQKAQDILEQITQQNEIMKANLERQDKLLAHNMLSGKAVAGEKPKTDDEKEDELVKTLMESAGF